MGLAGRKNKQRIGADPRNLTWSDDSSKFGAKYLQSLGWTSGSGLGVSGDGRASNLKIHQKLDLMGIGANRRGADDAGWKVGRQFEGLLARLNQAQNMDSAPDASQEENAEGDDASSKAEQEKKPEANEKRKRKRSVEDEGEEDPKAAKRRRKEEKKERKKAEKEARKKQKKSRSNSDAGENEEETKADPPSVTAAEETVKVAPRYRAHRARNLASKRLAAASTTGMNEILGIAPSSRGSSSIPFPVLMTPPREQPTGVDMDTGGAVDEREDPVSAMGLGTRSSFGGGLGFGGPKAETSSTLTAASGEDLLRKNGKSVAEYFAEKMRMKTVGKA